MILRVSHLAYWSRNFVIEMVLIKLRIGKQGEFKESKRCAKPQLSLDYITSTKQRSPPNAGYQKDANSKLAQTTPHSNNHHPSPLGRAQLRHPPEVQHTHHPI